MIDNKVTIEELLDTAPIISDMVDRDFLEIILKHLDKTLSLEGDVVELGCNIGTTSLWIRRLLNLRHSEKKFYVFDSFEGLPEAGKEDFNMLSTFKKGDCYASLSSFLENFKKAQLKFPIIFKGFFKEISLNNYPKKICFAFLDGDLYQSIKDSLEIVFPRLVKSSIVVIHDIFFKQTPGVEIACNEFFREKINFKKWDGIYTHE